MPGMKSYPADARLESYLADTWQLWTKEQKPAIVPEEAVQ